MATSEWLKIPGNECACARLHDLIASGKAIAFVGAGASAGLYPLWPALVRELANEAVTRGLATVADRNFWLDRTTKPQQAAQLIKRALGEGCYAGALRRIFAPRVGADGERFTPVHGRLVRLPFRGFVTTNYDPGLVEARTQLRTDVPTTGFSTWKDNDDISRWLNESIFDEQPCPILFAHGIYQRSNTIVLSANEYRETYKNGPYALLFNKLWGQSPLVFIGFGFSDYWLEFLADSVITQAGGRLTAASRHLAIIGLKEEDVYTPDRRRIFHDTYNADPLFYPVSIGPDGVEDHSALLAILNAVACEGLKIVPPIPASIDPPQAARTSRERSRVGVHWADDNPTIPPEYLGWLAARALGYGYFMDKPMRDRIASSLHNSSDAEVQPRSQDAWTDLHLLLMRLFRQENPESRFEGLLADNIPDSTRRSSLICYGRDLATLADLQLLLSHVELSLPEMYRCYTSTLRDPQRARPVRSLDEALQDLLDLSPSRCQGWRPLSEFVERIARLCRSNELHRWVEAYETDPITKSELNAALDAEQAGAAEHIVVDVPPEEPTRLEIWRRWGRNNVPTIHYFCPEEKYPHLPRAEAMAILAEQASNLSTNVCLEIFLPISMLANDIDQWQYATFEGVSRLGERHAVAVRWRERARDGVRLPQWQAFAATLEQKTFEDPALGWLEREHIGEPTFGEEIMRGRWGDFLAFSFIPFDADMQTPHNQLKSALGGGMAYGLWVRREPIDWHAFREVVAELFGAGDLNNMPARIKTARCVASKHDDNQSPFRNLTLFWDEPRRNPWSRGRLTEPGQKFRVE